MKCYMPLDLRTSTRIIKPMRGGRLFDIKRDEFMPKETMENIDKRVDTLQQKIRSVNLQPLKSKMKAIKISL